MKKVIYLIILISLIFLASCYSGKLMPKTPKKNPIFEISVTKTELAKKITLDGIKDGFQIESGDLIGSIVSLDTKGFPVVLTGLSNLEKSKGHNNGAMVFSGEITGGDIIEFPEAGGWLIVDAMYRSSNKYPETITIQQVLDEISYCLLFKLDSYGFYRPEVNFDGYNKPIITEAGYEYTDTCSGENFYLNKPVIKLHKVYIEIILDDKRIKKIGKTLKLPTEYN